MKKVYRMRLPNEDENPNIGGDGPGSGEEDGNE